MPLKTKKFDLPSRYSKYNTTNKLFPEKGKLSNLKKFKRIKSELELNFEK